MKHDVIFPEISVLKLQPRHGMADKFVTQTDAEKQELARTLENLEKTIPDALKELGDAYGDVYTKVNTSNLALQTGIGKLAGVFDGYAAAITKVIKEATFLEQRNKSLNVSLGINSNIAADLGEAYDNLA
jgi:hypothetical protein